MKFILIALLIITSLTAEARQHRSYHAIKQFKLSHLCPANGKVKGRCPEWIIDHIQPLACDGDDGPKNMQW